MQAAAADLHFIASLSRLDLPPAGVLADLARLAIRLYGQTADFTVLHLVTTCHAARVVFCKYPELLTKKAAEALWLAACAAYASIGAPMPMSPSLSAWLPNWPDICTRAVACDDDHVIKMTYTCRCEEAHYGDVLYRAAAARLVAAGTSQPG
jgi:hypothetical protein